MKVGDMTLEQLKELIHEAVEEKLEQVLGDPDWGLELREDVRERLRRSLEGVEKGEKGIGAQAVHSWSNCQLGYIKS